MGLQILTVPGVDVLMLYIDARNRKKPEDIIQKEVLSDLLHGGTEV